MIRNNLKTVKIGAKQFKIPLDWDISSIANKNMFRLMTGGTPSKSKEEYWGGEIPWMVSGDLHKKIIYEVEGRISQLGYDNSNATWIPKKSILIGLAGQGKTRGTVAINEIELTCNQSVAAIIPNNEIFDSYYVYHFFDSKYNLLRILSSGDGGRGGLTLALLRELSIFYPPIAEQQKIAAILSSVDDAIQATKRVIEKTQRLKRGLMQQLLTKGIGHTEFKDSPLGRIPKGWGVKKLVNLCNNDDGIMTGPFGSLLHSSDYVEFGTPIILIRNISEEGKIILPTPFVTDHDRDRLSKYVLYEGDIVISRVGTMGRLLLISHVEEGWLFSGQCLRIRPNQNLISPAFLFYFLKSDFIKNELMMISVGSTRVSLNSAIVGSLKIAIPSMPEQQKIVAILSSVDQQIQQDRKELNKLQRLKKGLMQQLLAGKLRVKT